MPPSGWLRALACFSLCQGASPPSVCHAAGGAPGHCDYHVAWHVWGLHAKSREVVEFQCKCLKFLPCEAINLLLLRARTALRTTASFERPRLGSATCSGAWTEAVLAAQTERLSYDTRTRMEMTQSRACQALRPRSTTRKTLDVRPPAAEKAWLFETCVRPCSLLRDSAQNTHQASGGRRSSRSAATTLQPRKPTSPPFKWTMTPGRTPGLRVYKLQQQCTGDLGSGPTKRA